MQLCQIHFYQIIARKKVARVNAALRDFWISELRTLLNSVTPSILRKNLLSNACTCDRKKNTGCNKSLFSFIIKNNYKPFEPS